jgi:hypothetical protein
MPIYHVEKKQDELTAEMLPRSYQQFKDIKGLILLSTSNPTGSMLTKEELQSLPVFFFTYLYLSMYSCKSIRSDDSDIFIVKDTNEISTRYMPQHFGHGQALRNAL